ncbi:placenta-expressed transcript 1 protein [Crotalus adamanteus]|uniref:Placenta-expressed transcript 1 protein n=1 Tax=Crotalus adamanteus TaxID=8729 RepID=A0AAW1AYZ3_CROAD
MCHHLKPPTGEGVNGKECATSRAYKSLAGDPPAKKLQGRPGESQRSREGRRKRKEKTWKMTWLKLTMPLFFLGALLVSPAYFQQPPCEVVRKTVPRGSFRLDVEPGAYSPNDIYTVSITGAEKASSVILQIVAPENSDGGLWEEENLLVRCSASQSVLQKNVSGSSVRVRWISSSNLNVGSAEIRAFVTFANGTTLMQSRTLAKEVVSSMSSSASRPTSSTRKPTLLSNPSDGHRHLNATAFHHNLASPHQSTKGPHSSVSGTQASSLLLAILQLLSVSLGYKLLA